MERRLDQAVLANLGDQPGEKRVALRRAAEGQRVVGIQHVTPALLLGEELRAVAGVEPPVRHAPPYLLEVHRTRYSHSIVPTGLGVRSYVTRQMPGTSARMRSVIFLSSAQSSSGTVAVMASTVLTARMMAGQS